ncbi:hypothetical protein KIP00_22685 [Vibrio sp. B513a]|uniref:hypothetical protein n=1 Tax=Vibrio sp. B513a TaxID=2836183 RepID=UPI0025530D77|nr:hypothetical protein [Vibrio sp. B513a]MDK9753828.1 hypothetical protein [Vibrio sp. B513a]
MKIETFDLLDKETQAQYLQNLASYLSFVVAKNEYNGRHGTPYVYVNYETFSVKSIEVENYSIKDNSVALHSILNITDSLSVTAIHSVKFNEENIVNINHNELLSYNYNGLKAESEKSKFFHLFLIVECLEGSARYNQMFPSGTMFSEKDKVAISNLANTFSNDKKNALLSILNRTSGFRNNKLFDFICTLGIEGLTSIQGTAPITIETIKTVTSARNKLFHRGSELPTNTLWFILFPLVTKIVEKTIQDQSCLESS